MATFLVTGCAGFIGAQTAKLLLTRGDSVVGVDELNNYYDPKLKRRRLQDLVSPRFSFVQADIAEAGAVRELFRAHRFDGVLNLAARAGVRASIETPEVYFATNLTGTLNLLVACQQHGVAKLLLSSTSSLYAGEQPPFIETAAVNRPLSPYAASKKAAESICYAYHHLYGLNVAVVRYFTVYGPAGRPDMSVFQFIEKIGRGTPITVFGDGLQKRDFTYVDDVADGTVRALDRAEGFSITNLGGGRRPYSIRELIALIEAQLGRPAVIEYRSANRADMFETQANIERARNELDWQPTIDLEEGVTRTVAWHQANREVLQSLAFS